MNEYKKRLAQQGSQKLNSETAAPKGINGIPNSVLNDVFAGKRRATNEMMGHRVDPAPSVLARMSQAFGMDFSGVQVYRSDAMNGTGMEGMAQGNKVVLGSDVDLNTQEGQAILGHEFSHIRAQSMGIGGGSGLLQDAGLEHQADNEGLLAARGMNISGESMGMSTGLGMAGFEGLTPLGGGMSATAAAPMQAFSLKPLFGFGKKQEAPKMPVIDAPKSARRLGHDECVNFCKQNLNPELAKNASNTMEVNLSYYAKQGGYGKVFDFVGRTMSNLSCSEKKAGYSMMELMQEAATKLGIPIPENENAFPQNMSDDEMKEMREKNAKLVEGKGNQYAIDVQNYFQKHAFKQHGANFPQINPKSRLVGRQYQSLSQQIARKMENDKRNKKDSGSLEEMIIAAAEKHYGVRFTKDDEQE